MELTRRGICYDLKNSPYKKCFNGYMFHFSSKNYLERFKNEVYNNRHQINTSLRNRFKYELKLYLLSDIVLYHKIEKRGFYIEDIKNGATYTCMDQIILGGEHPMKKN